MNYRYTTVQKFFFPLFFSGTEMFVLAFKMSLFSLYLYHLLIGYNIIKALKSLVIIIMASVLLYQLFEKELNNILNSISLKEMLN